MIDKDLLKSDEWVDLVRLAVEKVARIRNENRINSIAKILREIVINNIQSVSHAEDIIDVISELREEETLVLGLIYKKYKEGKKSIENHGEELKKEVSEDISKRMHFIIKRLDGIGILSQQTGSLLGYGGGTYYLTNTGKEICKFLINKSKT